MWLAFLAAAYADTLELDNGAVLVGELAAYDRVGDCHIAVGEGALAGAIVVVPCARVARFEREAEPFVDAAIGPAAQPDGVEDAPVAEPPLITEIPMALPAVDPQPHAPIAPPSVEPTAVAAQEAPVPAEPARRTWLDNLQFSDPFRR